MKFLVVHASATSPSMDVDAAWIDRIHKERGFRKIGYHYVIKRDGTIEKGREEHEMGAHVKGYNQNTLGICMIGGVKESDKVTPEDNFTEAQYESLENLFTELHHKYPEAEFAGHNDFPNHKSRGCPCFDHHTFFDILRIKLGINKLYHPFVLDESDIEMGNYLEWDWIYTNKK